MKLKCVISGKEVNVSPKVFQDRATKYGVDPEKLKSSYVSRESKRLLREGKSVDEIRLTSGVQGLNPVDQAILDSVLSKKSEDVTAS
jgi:hypothetical protein